MHFATSNEHKFKEAQAILKNEGIELIHFPFVYREIRSDDFEEIARDAVQAAYKTIKKPVFVEDGGLVVEALNGFPGTYSAWVMKKIGSDGILKLLENAEDRTARFSLAVAYTDGKTIKTCTAFSEGTIAHEKRGISGFGYDSVFIPKGYDKTFAESKEIKEMVSHRKKALVELAEFLKN